MNEVQELQVSSLMPGIYVIGVLNADNPKLAPSLLKMFVGENGIEIYWEDYPTGNNGKGNKKFNCFDAIAHSHIATIPVHRENFTPVFITGSNE
jgi:hypothetical protein